MLEELDNAAASSSNLVIATHTTADAALPHHASDVNVVLRLQITPQSCRYTVADNARLHATHDSTPEDVLLSRRQAGVSSYSCSGDGADEANSRVGMPVLCTKS